jgi:hypothetical protein
MAVNCRMMDEVEKLFGRKLPWPKSTFNPRICVEGVRIATKNPSRDCRCLVRDSNRKPHEYWSNALPLHQPVGIFCLFCGLRSNQLRIIHNLFSNFWSTEYLSWSTVTFLSLSIYGSIALVDLGRFFNFLIYTQFVRLFGREISPSQGRYLHTEQHKQNKHTRTSMSRVGFKPTIPAFERAKTVHALDCAATAIGTFLSHVLLMMFVYWIYSQVDWRIILKWILEK